MDNTRAHEIIATVMVITFVTVAVSQDWWKQLRDWVYSHTHVDVAVTPPNISTAGGGRNFVS